MRTALATNSKRKIVFAPKGRARQKGNPKKMIGFRPTDEVERWLNEKTGFDPATGARKAQLTPMLLDAIETQMHMERELGNEWWEVQKRAAVDRAHPGTVLAQLVRSALKRK